MEYYTVIRLFAESDETWTMLAFMMISEKEQNKIFIYSMLTTTT
jgi:hypothetical protein